MRLAHRSLPAAAVIALAVVFSETRAQRVCFSVTATVAELVPSNVELLGLDGVDVGTEFELTFAFESTIQGTPVDGSTHYVVPEIEIALRIAGAEAREIPGGEGLIVVTDASSGEGLDSLSVFGSVSFDALGQTVLFHLDLEDPGGSVFDSGALPGTLDEADFASRRFDARGLPGDRRSWLFDGDVGSIDPCPQPPALVFRRADVNDDGRVDVSDPIRLFGFLFLGLERPRCVSAADANDDGRTDVSDGIFILERLFRGGPAIPPPHPFCGIDPTEDLLPCDNVESCV